MVFPWVPAIAMHFPLLTTKPSSSALFTEVNLFPLNSLNKLLETANSSFLNLISFKIEVINRSLFFKDVEK